MAKWLREHTALAEDPNSVLQTHIRGPIAPPVTPAPDDGIPPPP